MTAQEKTAVVRLKLRHKSVDTFAGKFGSRINASSVRLPSKSPKPVDTAVRFELRIATGELVFAGTGVVTKSIPPKEKGNGTMLVEYSELEPDSQLFLDKLLSEREAKAAKTERKKKSTVKPPPIPGQGKKRAERVVEQAASAEPSGLASQQQEPESQPPQLGESTEVVALPFLDGQEQANTQPSIPSSETGGALVSPTIDDQIVRKAVRRARELVAAGDLDSQLRAILGGGGSKMPSRPQRLGQGTQDPAPAASFARELDDVHSVLEQLQPSSPALLLPPDDDLDASQAASEWDESNPTVHEETASKFEKVRSFTEDGISGSPPATPARGIDLDLSDVRAPTHNDSTALEADSQAADIDTTLEVLENDEAAQAEFAEPDLSTIEDGEEKKSGILGRIFRK